MSNGDNIRVNHALLDDGASSLRTSMGAIQALHSELDAKTKELSGSWYAAGSPDAVAWNKAHTDLGNLMLELSAFVGAFSKVTTAANEDQMAAEKAREGMFA